MAESVRVGFATEILSDDLLCQDGFYRTHWRSRCSDCEGLGLWRFYRSEAVNDADDHRCPELTGGSDDEPDSDAGTSEDPSL